MPVTVRNTDILFNDGTTQSTAAGAVTTTAVLNATAAASVGDVGSYAFLVEASTNASNRTVGSTLAGSSLRYHGLRLTSANGGAGVDGSQQVSGPAGTWRIMGAVQKGGNYFCALSLWLRIS
jgi:hypothetical protein